MPSAKLSELDQRMRDIIDWSENVNLAIDPCRYPKPVSDAVARMARLSLWLSLTVAFDGFIQAASRALGSERSFRRKKDRQRHEPDAVIRLGLLSEECGLNILALKFEEYGNNWSAAVEQDSGG